METPCYLSAATSPRSVCSLEDSLVFYSAPTSPTSDLSSILFGFKTDPTTPTSPHDRFKLNRSLVGETSFAFETNRCVDIDFDLDQSSDSLPMMSFADELFCDGKVVPLASSPVPKLKPPPGFHGDGQSSMVVMEPPPQPRSPQSILASRQCLWNDDFDPFMVALENVKVVVKEDDVRNLEGKKYGRAQPSEYYLGLLSPKSFGAESKGLLGKPKGVVFSKRVRLMKVGCDKGDEHASSPAQRHKAAKSRGKWYYYVRKNKRQQIFRRLFSRGSSRRKESGDSDEEEHNKVKNRNGAMWKKPTFLRGMSFRSITQSQHVGDKRVVSRVAKVSLIQYRPRLSLCMGFHGKVSA